VTEPRTSGRGKVAVVAEKPAVARDIARVLGAERRGDGCLVGNGYIVTNAHVVRAGQRLQVQLSSPAESAPGHSLLTRSSAAS